MTEKVKKKKETQWWLAKLDQYGNPTLCDGAHDSRAQVAHAMKLTKKLATTDNFAGVPLIVLNHHGYAIARVELEPIK